MSFEQFFETATGHPPFAYQRALGDETPEVLAVPTGSGKTAALIIPWLYRRREHGEGPRRLIYALPMRSLVEQTYEVALGFRERLALGETDLRVSVLMVGTQVAAAGVPMRTLQEWLGHRDIKTTMIYADYQESADLPKGYRPDTSAIPMPPLSVPRHPACGMPRSRSESYVG